MKNLSRTTALAVILLAAGCSTQCSTPVTSNGTSPSAQQTVTQPEVPIACTPQPGSEALNERASRYDSTRITLGASVAQVCYSRPAAKGRPVFGGLVGYGKIWRTGANEPTILHIPVAAEIAGIRVEPGSYSMYTIPTESDWTIILNRSTSQWGHESQYKADVQAQEVGRAQVRSERLGDHVEAFTITAEPVGTAGTSLVLDWERTRVRIPIRAVGR